MIMARKKRIAPAGYAQHVIQRGNNRAACFACEADFAAYVHWLKLFSQRYQVSIHAWVFMTNHVHLLCTPEKENCGISTMMQSLGRMYVRYFNKKYGRTGTLWEGRFKSSVVDTDSYLITLYRYIELNPVRAGMVSAPADYKWSSYRCNALGLGTTLRTEHPIYTALGRDETSRLIAYQVCFQNDLSSALVEEINWCSQRELVIGDGRFKRMLEESVGMKLKYERRGRPPKKYKAEYGGGN
jgi:putative transposase